MAPGEKEKPTKPKKAATSTKSPKAASKNATETENMDISDVADKDPEGIFETLDHATEGGKKHLSVEKIYKKLSQLDHVLIRPDTYVGSIEQQTETMWVYDQEEEKLVQREISYVPGLYKIFDEILVNAADNKIRDKKMNLLKIKIDKDGNSISVYNNGRGIPVVEHRLEKMYVPELIFGTLLTSSNYDDNDKKVVGGRNGYGAKLCNIFSKEFTVETCYKKRRFKMTWRDNMNKDGHPEKPTIEDCDKDDYTIVTFKPDLARFKMKRLDKDICDLMSRRALDVAGSTRGVTVFLNGKKLPCSNFKGYIEQYVKDREDEDGNQLKVEYENANNRWEIGVTVSTNGFQQVSFVNSIATTKGGRHVDYVADQIVAKLIEHIKKQLKKSGTNIRPNQVKQHLWVFVNALIENPTFDSQTKENMTLQPKSFGSKCDPSEAFMKRVIKNCGIVESVMTWVKFKQQAEMDKKCHTTKHSKLKGIPKLEDANEAGTKNSRKCSLILTEGDSAKTLAVSGLGVVGRDHFGVFPLKGKVLNVREATHKQIMENAEINHLLKILGLQYKKKYVTPEDLNTLRYGKIMIMADQDQDGSHIKGLLINFIHHNWPDLLSNVNANFVEEFITPIVKVTKGQEQLSFFSIPEYEEWKQQTPNWHRWTIKYYKGLGTSTAKEAKEYFSDMGRHRIQFTYRDREDDKAIELAFSKKMIEDRKRWLTEWMEERKRRKENGLSEIYLYEKDTKQVTYSDFINKELVLFSNTDNERSIPSVMDGFKPGHRKVMFTCFKRDIKKEIKVAQLAGSVAELSAYHHGEASLMGTIVGLAQNFVGSNNINVLMPIGQFGTRLQGGKDAASARYIFTNLNPLTRVIFNPADDACLNYLYDDNQRIEPEWYCPAIPMILVNGAEGIGTGWSTKIPNYNPKDIVANLRRMLRHEEPKHMIPWFKNFRGEIMQLEDTHRYAVSGEVAILDHQTVEITELPVRTWTQTFKEQVLEPMLYGTEKIQPQITDFKEYHTDMTVRFVIKMPPETMKRAQAEGLHKFFKLQTTLATSSMVLFDPMGVLRRYDNVVDILKDYFAMRLKMYAKRRDYLIAKLTAESKKLSNQAKFILDKIEGKIKLENVKEKVIAEQLEKMGYDADPVKKWKEQMIGKEGLPEEEVVGLREERDEALDAGEVEKRLSNYYYLVDMKIRMMTLEQKEKLLKEQEGKKRELDTIEGKTPEDLWNEDLIKFEEEYEKQMKKEMEEEEAILQGKKILTGGKLSKTGKTVGGKKIDLAETKPSAKGERIRPTIEHLKQKAEAADRAKEKAKERTTGRRRKSSDSRSTTPLENLDLAARLAKKKKEDSAKKGLPAPSEHTIRRFLTSPSAGRSSLSTNRGEISAADSDVELIPNEEEINESPAKKSRKENGKEKKVKETPTKGKKTKKKKNFDSDDELSGSDASFRSEVSDAGGNEEDDDEGIATIAATRQRRERKPMKYNFDEESDENEENQEMDDDRDQNRNQDRDPDVSDQDGSTTVKKTNVAGKSKKILDDSDDEFKFESDQESADEISKRTAKTTTPRKAQPPKPSSDDVRTPSASNRAESPVVIDLNEDDETSKDAPITTNKVVEKAAPKQNKAIVISSDSESEHSEGAGPKSQNKRKRIDSDESDEDFAKEKKRKAPEKKKAAAADSDEETKKATKMRSPAKKPKKVISDSEDDFAPEENDGFEKRDTTQSRPQRAGRGAVSYKLDDSASDSDI